MSGGGPQDTHAIGSDAVINVNLEISLDKRLYMLSVYLLQSRILQTHVRQITIRLAHAPTETELISVNYRM